MNDNCRASLFCQPEQTVEKGCNKNKLDEGPRQNGTLKGL